MVATAAGFLQQLRALGGDARFEGERVAFIAPAGVVPESLKQALSHCRKEIGTLLLAEQEGELAALGIIRCANCRRLVLAYHLVAGVCDDCRALPRPPEQNGLFERREP